jgi:ATP-binding cassette subfamily B protein
VEKTGDLIQRSTSDVIAANNFLSNQLTEIGRMAIMIIILIPYMFVINVKMAALSLVLSPFIAVLAVHYFRLFFRQSIKIEENESELTSTIQENLAGIRVVRAFARHALEREKFAKRSEEYYQSVVRYIDNYARFFGYTTTLAFGQLGIVLVGGSWMVIHNWVSVGTLVAFFTYSTAIAFTLRGLGVMLGDTSGAIVAIRRIEKILSTPVAVFAKDAAEVKLRGEIQFENVSFSYRKNQKILDNVTFHITPGERIAIVGPSGSGKSTIIELLLRNYDYQSGSIMLDDRELKDLDPRKVRSQIGTSLQDVFLFSDTVRSNIKMAKTNATDGEVKTASETAKIHDTIHEFPEKYDTHIGEKGVDLSGGQRQRMVLARAFVRKPPILILDDSLSAVDVHTEREILQELNKKHDDVTVIIVTHRLSCCLNADRILVLEDGKLTKIGAHSELIQEEGFYKRLWEIQQEIEQVSDKTELQNCTI